VNGEITSYALEINQSLTQVLSDETNAYLYGVNRIGEFQPGVWEYHLTDALWSVRQVVDESGSVTLTRDYEPFGEEHRVSGLFVSIYGFTGELSNPALGLVYLRARYYQPDHGRFISTDPLHGDIFAPQSLAPHAYVENNPINYIDPSGMISEDEGEDADLIVKYLKAVYNIKIRRDWGYQTITIPGQYGQEVQTFCSWEAHGNLNLPCTIEQ
jgi:RHS repeat-associated protein